MTVPYARKTQKHLSPCDRDPGGDGMPGSHRGSDPISTRWFEAQALHSGWRMIAGCDEAGRGALAGPLYVAAVILDPIAPPFAGLNDSKKVPPRERLRLADVIRSAALAFKVVALDVSEVDKLNVYEASRQGMIRALQGLVPKPDFAFTDAMPLSAGRSVGEFSIPHRSLVHGDARCASIAAASILAKVARDQYMEELGRRYPQYLLAKNKGYGTKDHLEALARYGPSPEHRVTFQPVKDCRLPLFPSPSVP